VTREVGGAPGADPQPQAAPTAHAEASAQAAQAAGAPRGTWDDPRVPWSGRPRRVDILLWAGIVLSGIYYWALLPFVAPLVGTHPVLLEVLNGNTAAIISAAAFVRVGHGSLVVVLLAAIPGLMKFDPLYWWAGRLWGERLIAILSGRRNRGGKYMGRVERWGRKFTWPAVIVAPFLPIPTAIIYVVVGWAGMRLVTFIILDVIGSLLWAGMLAALGYELGHHAVVVAQAISHYGLWISIGLIVVIVFFQVRSQRHMMQLAAQARPAATGGQASPAATGGQASPAATGGQASPAAHASRGDEPAADA
jgi:membrane-associated protein